MTEERREEARWFRQRIGAVMPRARVVADAEGWPMVPGKLGQVETALDRTLLAVYTTRVKMIRKFLAIPGVRKHQMGDREARMRFPADDPECLREVLAAIQAKRRRTSESGRNAEAMAQMRQAKRRVSP